MIKKIIACLTICFIITGFLSPVFSDASALPQPNWSDPGISEIINISDLTGWMLNGGTYDVSTYNNAEDFMNDYFNARTRTRLVSPGEAAEEYYEVLPGFGINNQLVAGESFARPLDTNRVIASSFRDHTGYGRRLSNEVNDALLTTGHLYDTKIPLLNEVEFANFVGYNYDALKLYANSFAGDTPSPVIPSDYSWFSNCNDLYIGSESIYNDSLTVYNSEYGYAMNKNVNLSTVSIVCNNNIRNWHTSGNANTFPGMSISDQIITINIDTSGSTVQVTYPSIYGAFFCSDRYGNGVGKFNLVSISNGRYNLASLTYLNNHNIPIPNTTTFNTLAGALDYIYQHYSNINLYVDNSPWLIAGSTPTLTPEFPDSVGGEELPTTTWPISKPHAPYYTSVPGMLQAIEDAIQGDGKLDIDNLKPYLTDENGDPVPDPIFDPEPVPIPVPDPINPDVIPGLPVLPAMPPEMPGFSGVSVLAEIINFTNQSLPTSLIVTFWGIVFGIVILGLIKILHK